MNIKLALLLLTTTALVSCTPKLKEPSEPSPNYVIDTTLIRWYPNTATGRYPKNWKGEVCNSDVAYRLGVSLMKEYLDWYETDETLTPVCTINLTDSNIWVIYVYPESIHEHTVVLGGDICIALRKSDGMIFDIQLGE